MKEKLYLTKHNFLFYLNVGMFYFNLNQLTLISSSITIET